MKITKDTLKTIIKEELEQMEEMSSHDPVTDALESTLDFIKSLEWDTGFQNINYGFAADRMAKLKQKVQSALSKSAK